MTNDYEVCEKLMKLLTDESIEWEIKHDPSSYNPQLTLKQDDLEICCIFQSPAPPWVIAGGVVLTLEEEQGREFENVFRTAADRQRGKNKDKQLEIVSSKIDELLGG